MPSASPILAFASGFLVADATVEISLVCVECELVASGDDAAGWRAYLTCDEPPTFRFTVVTPDVLVYFAITMPTPTTLLPTTRSRLMTIRVDAVPMGCSLRPPALRSSQSRSNRRSRHEQVLPMPPACKPAHRRRRFAEKDLYAGHET